MCPKITQKRSNLYMYFFTGNIRKTPVSILTINGQGRPKGSLQNKSSGHASVKFPYTSVKPWPHLRAAHPTPL